MELRLGDHRRSHRVWFVWETEAAVTAWCTAASEFRAYSEGIRRGKGEGGMYVLYRWGGGIRDGFTAKRVCLMDGRWNCTSEGPKDGVGYNTRPAVPAVCR